MLAMASCAKITGYRGDGDSRYGYLGGDRGRGRGMPRNMDQ
jgi:hypothetical protein